ncbi:restriction endonuclease subunit S [Synechococcus sp. UW140]|uniref:restriction endonuclease subunit S n=1 Tax=Synechococcus sp. UW140 TaxID=368503 RepID=UPI003137C02D
MTHKRYENYVDTQEAWLGSYPSHWGRKPLWTLFRRVKRQGFESEELLSVYRDHGVIPKSSREDNFNKPSDDLGAYQLVEPGDLAVNKMKAWQGSVAISEHRGIVSPAYHVYTPLHSENHRFLHYLMRCDRYITGYLSISNGIRINQWDLQPEYHSRMPVLLPPLDEQIVIASFLDHETAKIDALIAEQKHLIELLQEKRQAVISHAVTKGLNPNAPMKDSGVEWLGQVPEHWTAQKASWLFRAEKGKKAQELTQEYCGANEGPFPVFSGQTKDGGVMGAIDSYEFDVGETGAILCTTVGAKAMSIRLITGQFSLSQNCMVITSKTAQVTPAFFEYGLQPLFKHERALIPDHMQPSFRMEDFNQFWVQVPPIDEQARIAKYLQEENQASSELATAISGGIGLLQERRSALISAAVTGQIDVRGFVEVEGSEL